MSENPNVPGLTPTQVQARVIGDDEACSMDSRVQIDEPTVRYTYRKSIYFDILSITQTLKRMCKDMVLLFCLEKINVNFSFFCLAWVSQ